jgi:hypothetical protein
MACCVAMALLFAWLRELWFRLVPAHRPEPEAPFAPPARRDGPAHPLDPHDGPAYPLGGPLDPRDEPADRSAPAVPVPAIPAAPVPSGPATRPATTVMRTR